MTWLARIFDVPRRRQTGAILAIALVCLFVVALLGFALLRAMLLEHRQSRRRQDQMQAMWLAESAAERAAARLRASSQYEGETWRIEPSALGGREPGEALIGVERIDGDDALRKIVIEARYPTESVRRVVHRREMIVRLPLSGETP